MKRNLKTILIAILIIASLATRFIKLGSPSEVVFDEVHYGKHATSYFTGTHTFSGHPPLAPELIALTAYIVGYNSTSSFESIGGDFPNPVPLRLAPALAGSLIPLAVFMLAIVLGAQPIAAFLAGLILVFDNALTTQSRFVFIDPFLILFGIIGLIFFVKAKKENWKSGYLALSGLFMGLAMSVKWSAAGLFLIPCLFLAWEALKFIFKGRLKNSFEPIKNILLFFVILPIAVYVFIYALHVILTPNPGYGDAFVGGPEFRNKNIITRIIDLNKANYQTNFAGLTATHPYSSKFYTWPVLLRPIFYWVKYMPEGISRIFLIGNPIIWWGSSLCLILALILWKEKTKGAKSFLYASYIATLLPFLSVGRITFLYHYLPSLVLAVLISVLWLSDALSKYSFKTKVLFTSAFVAVIIFAFIYYIPLSYGTPLTQEQYQSMFLLKTWK